MRRLLRRRQGNAGCLRLTAKRSLLFVALAAAFLGGVAPSAEIPAPPAIRITSPLGRVGEPGTVRIVAQIQAAPGTVLKPVRFYIDAQLVGSVDHGPPYAVEWLDDNPFERREILVEVEDELGRGARDSVVLPPYEVTEATQVFSVLLEAAVRDLRGRFVSGLAPSNFRVVEAGVAQHLDIVKQERLPTMYALLIDASQSMARRSEFVRAAALRLSEYLRPKDQIIVAPFTERLGALTGPTDDHFTIGEAITAIRPAGGTAILDSLASLAERLEGGEGRRAIVLLTDGYDENSTLDETRAIDVLKRTRVTVYGIGIGGIAGISLRGERLMKRLADETGGQAFFPPREEALVDVYDKLATDAQNRYLLSYTPNNQQQDGTWRNVSIEPYIKTLIVKARPGYFAPKPAPIRPTLEFAVTDTANRFLDISADELIVREDGVDQKVETFQDAVTPLSLILALDASGSMKKAAPAAVEAARGFIETLPPQDSFALVLFNDRAVFAHDLTTVRDWSLDALQDYQADGGTALYDALADSLIRLRAVKGRRAIVVVTDGRDENNAGTAPGSRRSLGDVRDRLRETEALVYVIGLGTRLDREGLTQLATESGGQAYFPKDVTTLRDEYRRVVENLRRRYLITYTSTNLNRDGGWRKVEIIARRPRTTVNSRGGYFAPSR